MNWIDLYFKIKIIGEIFGAICFFSVIIWFLVSTWREMK